MASAGLSPALGASAGLSPALGAAAGLSPAFIASPALGVAAAGVAAGGGVVSVAQEAKPADRPRLATIKRAFQFIGCDFAF